MKALSLELDASIRKLYLRIAAAIRLAIKSGQLQPGEALPSARKLAMELKTNRHTVMAAYQELIAQSWVESLERRGYRVARRLPIDSSLEVMRTESEEVSPFQWPINKRFSQSRPVKPAHEFSYNFAGGMPDIEAFPFKEFKSHMGDSLSRPSMQNLAYGNNEGCDNFLEQVKTYLRRVRALKDKEIIAVNGSQEALFIIAQLLLKPGDKVAVEALGYKPAWNAFRSSGACLVPLKQHAKGIDLAHLTKLFEQENIKLIYLTPLHQYPTTLTIPMHERMEIYALAVRHQVIIVEDDYDHEFHYLSQPLAPMAADDPSGQVIYLSTFSKIMFPGCRVGFMAVDKSLAPAIINYRTIINHKPNVLIQDAIGRWMADGGFERHIRRMTKLYQQRRDHLVELLEDYKKQGIPIAYHLPAGGMALWLDIKHHAQELEAYCLSNDVYLLSETHFWLEPEQSENRYIRIGFAGLSSEKLTEGLAIAFDYFLKLQKQ